MKKTRICIAMLLIAAVVTGATGCTTSAKADDLMDGIPQRFVTGRTTDANFITHMADFSIELFKRSIAEKDNSLVSPLSVMLALAMTANGADGVTLSQMETLLGGDIRLSELNEYLYSYINGLPNAEKARLTIANSIWFRENEDRLQIEPGFLQSNADYYNAAAHKSAFDEQTVVDINSWANLHTDGMIDSILDEIDDDAMLYLINAIVFDAEWERPYDSEWDIKDMDFTDVNGLTHSIAFMNKREFLYIEDGMATGFIKPYTGGYSFVALLPNHDVPIGAYIESLTGAGFLEMIENAQNSTIEVYMPRFEYEYEISMNEALIALGIPDAFDDDRADFRNMAYSPEGNLYISEVLHKTFISVNERGTRAGAVTSVEMVTRSMTPKIRLTKPFVYAIIDDATNLPVFVGTLMTV